jgi:hypothetical protein
MSLFVLTDSLCNYAGIEHAPETAQLNGLVCVPEWKGKYFRFVIALR